MHETQLLLQLLKLCVIRQLPARQLGAGLQLGACCKQLLNARHNMLTISVLLEGMQLQPHFAKQELALIVVTELKHLHMWKVVEGAP
jgi:hypothetical protein